MTTTPLLRRAGWHRITGLIPVAYLGAIAAVGLVHPFVPQFGWLLIHLLFLGAATNAILVWGAHFASAILHVSTPPGRQGEVTRLILLNVGVIGVLVGGSVGPPWIGAVAAGAVFAAVAAHLFVLAAWLRRALPSRFAITVRFYVAAAFALLTGIPAGAWMLVIDDNARPRLILFHSHVNLLGWITLTALGTLLTLWPTVLRTRMVDGAVQAANRALRPAVAGVVVLGLGTLTWLPVLAVVGLGLFGIAVYLVGQAVVATARQKPPASFAAWSLAAGLVWLVVALAWDAVVLLRAPDATAAANGFHTILLALGVGFVAQILVGSLAYLLPMVLGGGPELVRTRLARLDAYGSQRVVMANVALVAYLLPVPSFVRVATSALILVALLQFLIPAMGILVSRTPSAVDTPQWRVRLFGGAAAGIALVLVAVLGGVVADRLTTGVPTAMADVPPTGHTTTVEVTAAGMRYEPNTITVPIGDRLVIVLTNTDTRRHDLVLANGARTAMLSKGENARLDAGVIGGPVAGWCSQPSHRQSGMTLTITTTATDTSTTTDAPHDMSAHASTTDAMAEPGPEFTARDASIQPASAETVHRVTLRAQAVVRDVAAGVSQTLWTFNGTAPGPVLRGRVGDIFEVTLVNETDDDHGIDFHAEALAPDRAMRPVGPGETIVYRFTAVRAGIWMYHCSAMPMLYHIGNGMYGALIIDPPDLAPVDREYVLVQSEFYLGPQGEPGDMAAMQADEPDAVVFNGYVSQYTFRPLTARVGERIRIWVLDAGPNRDSAFHVVGAAFDTVYVEGAYRLRPNEPGGAQVLALAPASGGFVEAGFAEAGTYPFLTHAMADADRGARGAILVTERP